MGKSERRTMRRLCLAVGSLLLVAACATQPFPKAYDAPGFFLGLLHGFIAPFALIASIFMDVRVYAFPNSGGWYDFGFILGIGALMGGGGSSVR
jgi:hypothetical protein